MEGFDAVASPGPTPGPLDDATSEDLHHVAAEVEVMPAVDPERAHQLAVAIRDRAGVLADEVLSVRAELVLAEIAFREGQTEAAARTFRAVNRWAQDQDHTYVLARSHRQLTMLFGLIGDDVTSLEHALRAVELDDGTFPPLIRADHLVALAVVQCRTRDAVNFRDTIAAAEQLVVGEGQPRLHLRIVNNLAYGEYLVGDYPRAAAAASRLLQLHDRYQIGLIPVHRDTIARALLEVGRFEEAESLLQELLEGEITADDFPTPEGLAEMLCTLGEVQRRGGRHEEARRSLARCREICESQRLEAVSRGLMLEEARLNAATEHYRAAYQQLETYLAATEASQGEARDARMRMLQAVFDSDEARRSSERFHQLALRDPLTGLYNRRYVDQTLPMLLGSGVHDQAAAAFVDLDHFKRINDTLSHDVGDEVLRRVSGMLETAVEGVGFAARMGGEEFLLVMPDLDAAHARVVVENLVGAIRGYDWSPVTGDLPVRASVGLASGPVKAMTQPRLLAAADTYVYAAKNAGRDRVVSGPA